MPKSITMNRVETIRAGNMLLEQLAKIDGTDYHAYRSGWSDERVAEEVGGRINEGHIARLRRSLGLNFPPLSRLAPPAETPAIDPRLDQLVEKHNLLCDLLTLNRIVDARGLRINHEEE